MTAPRAVEKAPARSAFRHRVALVSFGIVGGFLLAEVAVRAATHSMLVWSSPDDRSRYGVMDPLVGRIPRDGLSLHVPRGFTVHTGAHGTRLNGAVHAPPEHPAILAVGDSFAFGDQVDDAESWPAQLEQQLGVRVVNAGVPGFGLDQAVLRAEQLAPLYGASTIVVGFIPHDVTRCEMSYWSGHAKPYFDIAGNELVYHPAPVSSSPGDSWWKSALAHSVVIDRLFSRALHWDGPDAFVHHRGGQVACLLMVRLARLAEAQHATVIVVAYPQAPDSDRAQAAQSEAVLACASNSHLQTLDLVTPIRSLDAATRRSLYRGHFTPAGNRLVATELARRLRSGSGF